MNELKKKGCTRRTSEFCDIFDDPENCWYYSGLAGWYQCREMKAKRDKLEAAD